MDYEKKYNEAIKRAKQHCADYVVETIFPELKESEGERIMKNIISWLKNIEGQTIPINDYNSAIAWLEKQGEHKQTDWLKSLKDRVQPKQEWSEEDERNLYYWLDNNKSIGNDKYRWLLSLKDRVQPKQEWSEEDKYNHNIILSLLNNECVGSADKRIAIGWLKSLKDKVQPQPKQWWSEEDDIHFDRILKELKEQKQRPINYPYLKDIDSDVDWLKSLKDRYTWKPSDEQMKLLREVQQALLGKDCHNRFVNFMYELKRLREE